MKNDPKPILAKDTTQRLNAIIRRLGGTGKPWKPPVAGELPMPKAGHCRDQLDLGLELPKPKPAKKPTRKPGRTS